MGIQEIKASKVEKSMRDNFSEEINKEANWRYSADDHNMVMSGRINGKEHTFVLGIKHLEDGKLVKMNYPNHCVRLATEFYQKIIADAKKPEPVAVPEEQRFKPRVVETEEKKTKVK